MSQVCHRLKENKKQKKIKKIIIFVDYIFKWKPKKIIYKTVPIYLDINVNKFKTNL